MKYKKIVDIEHYNKYCEIHEKLTFKNYNKHQDEIELLQILIDEYDSREVESNFELNPVELLDYILEEEELSKSQLARELKVSRQLITDILMYRRNISKRMVMKLSKRFKMQPKSFSREYSLKNSRQKNLALT